MKTPSLQSSSAAKSTHDKSSSYQKSNTKTVPINPPSSQQFSQLQSFARTVVEDGANGPGSTLDAAIEYLNKFHNEFNAFDVRYVNYYKAYYIVTDLLPRSKNFDKKRKKSPEFDNNYHSLLRSVTNDFEALKALESAMSAPLQQTTKRSHNPPNTQNGHTGQVPMRNNHETLFKPNLSSSPSNTPVLNYPQPTSPAPSPPQPNLAVPSPPQHLQLSSPTLFPRSRSPSPLRNIQVMEEVYNKQSGNVEAPNRPHSRFADSDIVSDARSSPISIPIPPGRLATSRPASPFVNAPNLDHSSLEDGFSSMYLNSSPSASKLLHFAASSSTHATPSPRTTAVQPGAQDISSNNQSYPKTSSTLPSQNPNPNFPSSFTITPQLFYQLLSKYPDQMLVIDIRSRAYFNMGHIPSSQVICIEPMTINRCFLDPSKSLEEGLVESPQHEQVLFKNRDKYALVVYYDANTRSANFLSGDCLNEQEQTLHTFSNTIYQNPSSKALQRPPSLLLGGLEEWINLYTANSLWKSVTLPTFQDRPESPAHLDFNPFSPTPFLASPVPIKNTLHSSKNPAGSPASLQNSLPSHNDSERLSSGTPENKNISDGATSLPISLPEAPAVSYECSGVSGSTIAASSSPQSQVHHTIHEKSASPQSPPAIPYHSHPYSATSSNHSISSSPVNPVQAKETSNSRGYFSNCAAVPMPRPNVSHSQSAYKDLLLSFTTGLTNLGNSCYMNCILQCLYGTRTLTLLCIDRLDLANPNSRLGYKGELYAEYVRLLREMVGRNGKYVSPVLFRNTYIRLCKTVDGSSQQDCQEFLSFLLDGLHEELNVVGHKQPLKPLTEREEQVQEQLSLRVASANQWKRYLYFNNSPITTFLQGQYLSRLLCTVCNKTSTTYNTFSSLSLPIPLNTESCTLEDCFSLYTRPEILEGENAWLCPFCKKRQRTVKQIAITRLPNVLVVHLSRFRSLSGMGSRKLDTFVSYQLEPLDLTRFWVAPGKTSNGGKAGANGGTTNVPPEVGESGVEEKDQRPPFQYKLYAVATHKGSLKDGHYTSFVKRGRNGWCYFDDARMSINVHRKHVVTKDAYVLFFERIQVAPQA